MTLGAKLRRLRLAHGVSESAVARAIGLTQSAISLFEREKKKPSLSSLIALSKYYGVPIDFFVTDETAERD